MFKELFDKLKADKKNWDNIQSLFHEKEILAKTTLLSEGEISKTIYFIKKGCLRMWFNNDGKDITFQFFFENKGVCSLESFFNQQPSLFYIESIEASSVVFINKNDFDIILSKYPEIKEGFNDIILKRLSNYTTLFLSRIKDNPQKRYNELMKTNPEIIQRIPQHYIASYLGITPVSLSRIRNKK